MLVLFRETLGPFELNEADNGFKNDWILNTELPVKQPMKYVDKEDDGIAAVGGSEMVREEGGRAIDSRIITIVEEKNKNLEKRFCEILKFIIGQILTDYLMLRTLWKLHQFFFFNYYLKFIKCIIFLFFQ